LPVQMLSKKVSIVHPAGEIIPSPVTTTGSSDDIIKHKLTFQIKYQTKH
jgi:hypothetical protein